MRIVLARHGKPDLPHGVWISPRQMKDWIRTYDQANVLVEDLPNSTLKIASNSGVIVSSALLRSKQSAQALGQNEMFWVENIFREVDLPHTHWIFPMLPPLTWSAVFRVAWFFGFSTDVESLPQAKVRACRAADRLVELAQENGSVFHVGHGIMTMLIARQLLRLGWSGPKCPINRYWRFSVYHAPK